MNKNNTQNQSTNSDVIKYIDISIYPDECSIECSKKVKVSKEELDILLTLFSSKELHSNEELMSIIKENNKAVLKAYIHSLRMLLVHIGSKVSIAHVRGKGYKIENIGFISVMQRTEYKYILTPEQTEFLKEKLVGHMEVDQYSLTSIASLYYDTPDYQLIRNSVDRPKYKEKIRARSYGLANNDSPIFLEIKRKCEGIVYKRRIVAKVNEVNDFFRGKNDVFKGGQIVKEITYFRDFYKTLRPSCLIIYDRIAYREPEGTLRVTIDANPRYRLDNLNLITSLEGHSLLPEGYNILEIKVQDAIPLWLVRILEEGKIRKNSFSKYGEVYKTKVDKENIERIINYV